MNARDDQTPSEFQELLALLETGYIDEWAPTAHALLDRPRYREAADPVETLAADVRLVSALMSEPEGRDLRHLVPSDAESATSRTSRWKAIRGGDSGTALKWRGWYVMMRLLEDLRRLEDSRDSPANPPGCRVISVESDLRLSGRNYETRTLTVTHRLRSTRDDFRVFTFNRVGKLKPTVVKGGVQVIGSVPLQPGATRGRRLYAVYLGRSIPRDTEISFTLRWRFKEIKDADPFTGYSAGHDIGTVLVTADVPTALATGYDRVELKSTEFNAKELERKRVERVDGSPMAYRINQFMPGRYYRLIWYRDDLL